MGGAESVVLDCIASSYGAGGSQSVVALGCGPLLAAAQELGARTTVVELPAAVRAIGESFASSPAVLRTLVRPLWAFPEFFRRYSRTVESFAPEMIHSHGIKTHVLAAMMPRRAPVVWHLHDYLGTRSVSSKLLPLLARRCALAIAVSDSVAKDAREQLPDSVPVAMVHNAVDCVRFSPDGPTLDLDACCGLPPAPDGTVRIGLPAAFARWKGHEVFLEAVALLQRDDLRAYVIGGPMYETGQSQWSLDDLLSMVASRGLQSRIGFTGFLPDMPAAYRALDVVVHASTRPEPFGLVIAEAMACGRAVVAAPTGGAAELFVDGQHALAAESGNATAVAAALRRLIDDRTFRRDLGARARAHVLSSFDRERFARSLQAALGQINVTDASASRS